MNLRALDVTAAFSTAVLIGTAEVWTLALGLYYAEREGEYQLGYRAGRRIGIVEGRIEALEGVVNAR